MNTTTTSNSTANDDIIIDDVEVKVTTDAPAADAPATDAEVGKRIVRYCINSLAWTVTVCAAWSCASIVAAIAVAIIVGTIMYLLAMLMRLIFGATVDAETFAMLGHAVRAPRAYFDGFIARFSKKPAAEAAAA